MSKVLIVDDDRTTVKLLRTLLELDGFDVAIAAFGSEVNKILDEFQPDILLVDYHLSDTNGAEILRELRRGPYAHLPVVMASGLDVETEVMEAGADHFLVKPFEPDELPGLFRRLINR